MSMSDNDWLKNMVQIEAQSTPECQEGVPSQGWQQREEPRVVYHVQVEHYQGLFKRVCVIVSLVGKPESYPLHNSRLGPLWLGVWF